MFKDCVSLREASTTVVADLILPNNQGWNLHQITKYFIPSEARIIRSIELPARPGEKDSPYWPFTRSGDYTTKSGYGFLASSTTAARN